MSYVIRKPESISWLRSQRRRKHMREERKKWNARELFLMIEEELERKAGRASNSASPNEKSCGIVSFVIFRSPS